MKFEDINFEEELGHEAELEAAAALSEPEVEEPVEEAAPVVEDPTAKELEALRIERQELQNQLKELSVSTLADRRRLEVIEKSLHAQKEEPVDEGPSPEDVINYLDQQIAKADSLLSRAELEDPSKAPALRQQLRQLERYYNNYVNQYQASQAPRPEDVVNQAVAESTTHGNFQAVKSTITQEYPILDAKSQYFNEQLRDQVHEIYNPMIQNGADPVEALAKATTLVMRANGIMSLTELSRQQNPDAKAEKAQERKVAQVAKNLKASKDTPPNLSMTGTGSAELGSGKIPDFANMPINDFMKMSDSQIEEMERALSMYEG